MTSQDALPVHQLRPARQLRVLGGMQMLRGGRPESTPPALGRLLLGSLAVSGGELTVDEITDRLWPDARANEARARFRDLLRRMRSQLGDVVVRSEGGVRLSTGVEVDLQRFRHAARLLISGAPETSGEWGRALAADACMLYRGLLLPTVRGHEWVDEPRAETDRLFREVAQRRIRQLEDESRVEEAAELRDRARSR